MVSLIEWLLAEGYAVRVLTGDRWDDDYLQHVLQTVRARHPDLGPERFVGEPARDLHQLMNQMRDVEVVIAGRYHNVIMALRLAKPILAMSYAPKADQALEQFGLSSFRHRVDAIDLPKLKQQFTELYRRRAEIERQLRITLATVEAKLESQREQFVAEFLLSRSPSGHFDVIPTA
jgi:polysaccharide pyruvyl transferase WcaK-like protein